MHAKIDILLVYVRTNCKVKSRENGVWEMFFSFLNDTECTKLSLCGILQKKFLYDVKMNKNGKNTSV